MTRSNDVTAKRNEPRERTRERKKRDARGHTLAQRMQANPDERERRHDPRGRDDMTTLTSTKAPMKLPHYSNNRAPPCELPPSLMKLLTTLAGCALRGLNPEDYTRRPFERYARYIIQVHINPNAD